MADSVWGSTSASAVPATTVRPRHCAVVRATHWITTLCFLALLVSGVEILISHPRFYWGEAGNVLTPPLFKLPIPASRATVPTGYGYVLPDQNGWSRYLHFQSAWVCVLTGLLVLGGQQSARTIHFFVSVLLVIFLLVHVVMVCLTGFRNRVRAMITGRPAPDMERV
jgi:Ni,Fe-hydrogenase I cytochrome b subunit